MDGFDGGNIEQQIELLSLQICQRTFLFLHATKPD